MQRLCDWVKGRSISVSHIYIYIQESWMYKPKYPGCMRSGILDVFDEYTKQGILNVWII